MSKQVHPVDFSIQGVVKLGELTTSETSSSSIIGIDVQAIIYYWYKRSRPSDLQSL